MVTNYGTTTGTKCRLYSVEKYTAGAEGRYIDVSRCYHLMAALDVKLEPWKKPGVAVK